MATITIEVPDEVAKQLSQDRHLLTELLFRILRQPPVEIEVYRHILEFIASNPSPEQISAFEAPPEMKKRVQTLIARERTNQLRLLEKAELDEYEWIEHIIVMLKTSNLQFLTGRE